MFVPDLSVPEPFACALTIVVAMSAAGAVHAWWMRSRWSVPFRIPLDGGATWRGRRLLGDHKTLRGFMAIVPAAGCAFAGLGLAREALPVWLAAGLWDVSAPQLFLLGCWAGFWFMAGELPNSFLKRRLDVAPGAAPVMGGLRYLCLVLDRFDSTLALLIGLGLLVPMHVLTWVWVLVIGPAVHFAFSGVLYRIGVKARWA